MRTIFLLAASLLLISPLAHAQGKTKPLAKAPTPKLRSTEFPDGTGTIGIAPGWRLDGSYRGTVGCKGSIAGQGVTMGTAVPILRPDHPVAQMPEARLTNTPVAPVGNLGAAIRAILEKGGAHVISLRSRPAPAAAPGIPAFFYLYEYAKPDGTKITALGYFSALAYQDSSPYWQLYSSFVNAPSERFMKDLPTMMAMWNTWRPNGQKPKPGSDGAMIDATIKENYERNAITMEQQRKSFEQMQEKFKSTLLE